MRYKKFKSITREERLRKSGRKFYCNVPEDLFACCLADKGIDFTKRGYPDFTVYNSDGSIYGFVEVKPKEDKRLKDEQSIYGEFCKKNSLPFLKWTKDTTPEQLNDFLRTWE